jgi:hypothetical protein
MIYAHTTLGQTNAIRVASRRSTPGTWHVARPVAPEVAAKPADADLTAPAKQASNRLAMDHRATCLFLAFAVTACIFAAVLGAFDGAVQRGSAASATNAVPAPAMAIQATPVAPQATVTELRRIELPTVVIVGKRL